MSSTTSACTDRQGAAPPTLLRELNWVDCAALVAGGVIGSGIFLVPARIAGQLPDFRSVLLVWVVGGVLTVFGAVSMAELGAMFPNAGGIYIYLREIYGRPMAFVYGWGLLAMIHSGSVATLGAGFSVYVAQLLGLGAGGQKAAGVMAIAALTGLNCLGIRTGKWATNAITAAKLGGLAVMISMLLLRGSPGRLVASGWLPENLPPVSAFGMALVGVLWAYEAWHQVCFVAGEIRRPERDLPRGLFVGTLAIVGVYLLANVAYYSVLDTQQIQGSTAVAAAALSKSYGPAAVTFVSVLLLVSILGALHTAVICGPRVYYAMAREGLFFQKFGWLHPRYRVPTVGLVVQGLWGAGLTLLANFQQLFTYVIFTAWIFYGLCVAGVVLLRIRRADVARPFHVPGYPLTPAIFALAALGLTVNTILADPGNALFGISFILAGIPLYYFFRRTGARG